MIHKTKKTLLLSISVLLLSSCAMAPANKGQEMAELTYEHIVPVRLNALSVEQPVDFIAAVSEADVANDFLIPPAEAVHDYFARKLVPAGAVNDFAVELEQASILRGYVPSSSKWKSLFQVGAVYEYALTLKFKMLLREKSGRLVSGKRLVFNKQFFIPVSDSIVEREGKQMAVIESLIGDVDMAVSAFLADEKLALPEVSR